MEFGQQKLVFLTKNRRDSECATRVHEEMVHENVRFLEILKMFGRRKWS